MWSRSGRPPECVPHVVACPCNLVPRHLGEFRTPVSHEFVLSVATSACHHNVPALSLRLSFQCVRPAEARQLRWCDVKTFSGSLSTRFEGVHGIVNITEPKNGRPRSSATRASRMPWNLSAGYHRGQKKANSTLFPGELIFANSWLTNIQK